MICHIEKSRHFKLHFLKNFTRTLPIYAEKNRFTFLVIDYYHNPSLNFSNLKSLELCNMYIGYIKKHQLLCPNLEVLRLENTQYTGVFLEELIPLFKNSLTQEFFDYNLHFPLVPLKHKY